MSAEITVIVPVRAPAPYLGEALASIEDDSSAAAEVIVVEDGTRELTEAEFGGARLLRLPHVGRSAARNTGVEAATTELVAFLDADDVSLPGRLEWQAEALASAPGAALCFGPSEVVDGALTPIPGLTVDERRRYRGLLERGTTYESLVKDCPIYTSATMVRRDAFLAVGGYDVLFDSYEDLDLYLRLARSAYLVPLPADEPVALHRIHGANTPSDHMYAGAIRVAGKHLPAADAKSARVLREWQVDSLWGLGDFRRARHEALRLVAQRPALLAQARFRKRVAASALPVGALKALRERRG